MIRIIRNAYPVQAIDQSGRVVRSYPSQNEAARAVHAWPNSIREALERGTRARGYWWRYADMPAACQPLKPPRVNRRKCVVRGRRFPSVAEAARAIGVKPRTLWMRLWRRKRRHPSPLPT